MSRRAAAGTEEVVVDLTGGGLEGLLMKKVIKQGSGDVIPNGMVAEVHYTGTLSTSGDNQFDTSGKQFDSSRSRGSPFNFTVGQGEVIKAWDKAVATMRKGERVILRCHPDYAYGKSGAGSAIPPNATLLFDVELLGWKQASFLDKYGTQLMIVFMMAAYFYFLKA